MGNHDVGRALAAAASVFWTMVPAGTQPTKDQALSALEVAAGRYRGADAEFDDELRDGVSTPLGRMVAIAFDATPEEAKGGYDDQGDSGWYDGAYERFRKHFGFC